jgi:putative DNA methylase
MRRQRNHAAQGKCGLEVFTSDLNPIAITIQKALLYFPPRFSRLAPVNPVSQNKPEQGLAHWHGKRAEGLGLDIEYYGARICSRALEKLGHLYPTAESTDGRKLPVVAWLWCRTVASPNPAAKGVHVPLVSSFVLSSRKGREAVIVPRVDSSATSYDFEVKTSSITAAEMAKAKLGTKAGKAQDFVCALTQTPIKRAYIQAEGKSGRLGVRLMAVVASEKNGQTFKNLSLELEQIRATTTEHETAREARDSLLAGSIPTRAMITGGICSAYGLRTWGHLFTSRQLISLLVFSDLVRDVHHQVVADAKICGLPVKQIVSQGVV